jgi:1-aminocyclopropane-1-carboxylate deaminase/D-cysteine desulfhydrase-like pyridoxal-dependent ACC family enzyme
MEALAEECRARGRRPYVIPLGASTSLGAMGFVRAVAELLDQVPSPDVIVHACSSGGTQAGLAAGLALHGVDVPVIGISADDPARVVRATVGATIAGIGALLGREGPDVAARCRIEVRDDCVGEGYGIPTAASLEAQSLAARTEAIFVDHTYTAKALGALIEMVRAGRFHPDQTVLFWHTGGQVGLFA